MKTVNIREVRRRLSGLIDGAERGESVVITRHGKEVARLGAAPASEEVTLPDLSHFRAEIENQGQSLSKVVSQEREQTQY